MAYSFSLPALADPLKRNRYEVTNAETLESEGHKILVLDEGSLALDDSGQPRNEGNPINIDTMNEFSTYLEGELDKKVNNDDSRLSNSRRCDNTFDDPEIARNNLSLHEVAVSGDYNDLINKPAEYKYFQSSFFAARAGFSSLGRFSNSSDTVTKTLNYKKKYCFVGYGGYTAGMLLSVSGGYWTGESLDFASDFIVIPTYTGSMAGSQKTFYFITNSGIYVYQASGNDITIRLSRPDCYAYKEESLYSY